MFKLLAILLLSLFPGPGVGPTPECTIRCDRPEGSILEDPTVDLDQLIEDGVVDEDALFPKCF